MRFFRKLWHALHRSSRDAELREELDFHEEMKARELAAGRPASDLPGAVRRAMGNVTFAREQAGDVWRWLWVDDLLRDVRFGWRGLLTHRGFTTIAVLTLAIGIGLNTAIFTVIRGIVLRPLPYAEPGRLAMIWMDNVKQDLHEDGTSVATFRGWRRESRSFSDMAAFAGVNRAYLTGAGDPEPAQTVRATANLFSVLGVAPMLGSAFSETEEDRAERVVVISHDLWQRRFAGSADAIGKTIEINGRSSRVVGVMPAGFYFPVRQVAVYEPATLYEGYRNLDEWNVVARLRDRLAADQAQKELVAVHARLRSSPDNRGIRVVPLPLQVTGSSVRGTLWILAGAVGFVLLIACANVANLMLARSMTRGRELALRTALGAGRHRLLQQLLTENVMLGVAAGILGLAAAVVGVRVLVAVAPAGLPRLEDVSVDGSVVLFMVGLSVLTSLVFGLVPAWKLARGDANAMLHDEGRGIAGGRHASRTRGILVVVECALTVTLLAGAGLLIRSYLHLQQVDLGFDPTGAVVVPVSRTSAGSRGGGLAPLPVNNFRQQLLQRVAGIPGVRGVGTISHPYGGVVRTAAPERDTVAVDAGPSLPGRIAQFDVSRVSTGFLEAMRVTLRQGRHFTDGDLPDPLVREARSEVVVVTETFARTLFGAESAVGRRIKIGWGSGATWRTIVGVVGDIRHQGLEREPFGEVFEPGLGGGDLVVRIDGDPVVVVGTIRGIVRSLDPNWTVLAAKPLDATIDELGAERRFQTSLLALFAATALVLSLIGVFALTHYAVAQRTQELGVRIALGARAADVFALVIGDGMRFTIVGVAAGLAAATGLTRVLRHSLVGITAYDPLTFGGVTVLLVGTALLACYVPARRGTSIDPVVALRHQ